MFIVIVIDSQDIVWENVIFFFFFFFYKKIIIKNIQKAKVESKAFKIKKKKTFNISHSLVMLTV